MQNQNKKTDSRKCEKYAKYEYEKLSYTETYGVLQSLREDEVFCDIKLETDDHKIILAHKVVLASESPYFYSMFTKFSKKNHDIVVMREIHSTALQLLVNFIYSGHIVVTGENVQDLLPVANLLQLQEVKEVCCDFLQTQLCPTNCIGIYDIADLHSCTKLLTNSELYIQQHFSEVAVGDEFLSLSSEKLIKLISTDKLNVPSEKKVFESVIRWVKHELDLRNGILPQLMEHVRLPLTSESYILKEVVEEPLIKNCVKCKDYISEALNFHRHRSEEPIPQNIRNNPRHEDKVILVVGGFDMKLNTLFYDPKMNRWHDGPKMIQSRKNASLALVKDNLVFAVGGSDYRGNALLSVDVLDLSSESPRWESSKTMFVEQNITGVPNNKLYNTFKVGGFNFCDNISDSAKVFDYNTQKWRMISTMCTLRYDFAVGVLNDLLYVTSASPSRKDKFAQVNIWGPCAPRRRGRVMYSSRPNNGTESEPAAVRSRCPPTAPTFPARNVADHRFRCTPTVPIVPAQNVTPASDTTSSRPIAGYKNVADPGFGFPPPQPTTPREFYVGPAMFVVWRQSAPNVAGCPPPPPVPEFYVGPAWFDVNGPPPLPCCVAASRFTYPPPPPQRSGPGAAGVAAAAGSA